MPTVKDKTTGDVVSRQPYTAEGTQRAEQIAESDPTWEIDYAPGGSKDATGMREQMYAGGGKTGYNKIGMYKKGGKVLDKNPDASVRSQTKKAWKDFKKSNPKTSKVLKEGTDILTGGAISKYEWNLIKQQKKKAKNK